MLAVVSMVKDEADIIEGFVRRMAAEADFLIVADNGSTDGTRDMLEDMARDLPLTVVDDPEVGYYQSRKMTALVAQATKRGAEVVIPADADEVWYSPFGRIADVLAKYPYASVFGAALYDHVATAEDPDESDPVQRIGWRRREAAPLPKVAVRPFPCVGSVTIHQGNHGASHGMPVDRLDGLLVVRHFPYRSSRQFVRKVRNGAAAYAATDLPEQEGQHWRDYGRLLDAGGPAAIDAVFKAWFYSADPWIDPTLIYDPAPVPCPLP
jgi:glycosyltransferase involved in cell wall biosynthesis